MNEHHVARYVNTMLAISKEFGLGLEDQPDVKAQMMKALREGNEAMLDWVHKIDIIVGAFLDTPNTTMDAAARELINLVAAGGRSRMKEFLLPVMEGPGRGDWAAMVSPVEMKQRPAIEKPNHNVLRMPPRFRLT